MLPGCSLYQGIVLLAFKCLFLVLSLQPSVTRYDFVFKGIHPLKDSFGEYNFHVCFMCVSVCVYGAYI